MKYALNHTFSAVWGVYKHPYFFVETIGSTMTQEIKSLPPPPFIQSFICCWLEAYIL